MARVVNVVLIAALLWHASAARARSRKRVTKLDVAAQSAATPSFVGPASTTVAQGEPGQVDFVYNFGAPGPASPGLQNQRGSDPCFQGLRLYHSQTGDWWGEWIDFGARAGNYAFYWHSWMPSLRIDLADDSKHLHPCSFHETHQPDALSGSIELHHQDTYIASVKRILDNPYYTNVTIFAGHSAYMHNRDYVYSYVQRYGWGLVGSAFHPGGTVYGGPQVTHLIQHPSTNECLLTFQGTNSVQGWVSNFDFPADHFCGLVEKDESCSYQWSTCETRNPRGSFVHSGFKERLMSMVQTDEFQNNIRPYLPQCSRLVAVGHSLGGAVAELFTACASKAPQPGEYGYDDYKYMSWTKGVPAKLTYVGE